MMKNKNKIFVISVFLIIFLSLSNVCATELTDNDSNTCNDVSLSVSEDNSIEQTVNYGENLEIGNNEVGDLDTLESDGDGSFTELNNLINGNGNNITLNKNYAYNSNTDADFVNGIVIDKSITINGDNHTIDGLNTARIFNISTGISVTISNINFINSKSDYGGAIYSVNTNTITLTNNTFTNNEVTESGGAIYSVNTNTITLINNTFNDNNATRGGAIYQRYVNTATLINNTFNDNNATRGGAIYQKDINTTLTNNTFTNNNATRGGAIYQEDVNTSTLTNNTFTNNEAIESGGAIYQNDVNTSTIKNNTFNDNNATRGGAIYSIGSNSNIANIANNTFTNNNAKYGGAIYQKYVNTTLTNNTFNNNTAITSGGAIYQGDINTSTINNIFNDNNAKYGGAIFQSNNTAAIIANNTFSNNTAKQGGAIQNHNTNATIINNTLLLNNGFAVYNDNSNTTLTNNRFQNNDKAIYNKGTLELNNNIINTENPEIYNIGIINSTINVIILNNETINALLNSPIKISAIISDDNGNLIEDYTNSLIFVIDGEEYYASYNNYTQLYEVAYNVINEGNKVVNVKSSNYTDIDVKTGTIHVIMPLNCTITAENISYGDVETIKFNVVDCYNEPIKDLTLKVNVNNETYDVAVKDGVGTLELKLLDAGYYAVTVSSEESEEYGAISVFDEFEVLKADVDLTINVVNITYKETEIISINIPSSQNINTALTVKINDNEYIIPITNGYGILRLDNLTAGNYNVEATLSNNGNYNDISNSTSFTVNKAETEINVNFTNRNKTNKLVIITVEKDATGTIELLLDNGTSLGKYDITNGKIITDVSLIRENYIVNIVYSGDDNYNNNSKAVNVEFEKLKTELIVLVDNIKYGENASIFIKLIDEFNNEINDTVTVKVDGKEYNLTLEEGIGTLIVENLKVGEHSIDVEFNPESIYEKSAVNTSVTVNKLKTHLIVITEDTDYGEDPVLDISLIDENGNRLNETVTIIVDGKEYNVTLEDGIISYTLENLTVGQHTIQVVFNKENYENAIDYKIITLNKASPKNNVSLDIQAENIKYGENATITVIFNGVADDKINDTITLSINGEEYAVELTDNIGSLNISRPESENYIVVATFNGNENYTMVIANTSFTVNPSDEVNLSINTTNTSYGENNTIEISLTGVNYEKITGIVNLTVNNITYSVAVIDGVGNLTISDLNTGDYTINAEFLGNKNYTSTAAETDFQVSKDQTTSLTIIPINITYGLDETISISLNVINGGINGTVIIKIENETYTTNTINGIGIMAIPNLIPGNYTAEATYEGDDNYEGQNTSANFTVSKSNQAKIKINSTNIQYGENETINIILTGNNQTPLNGTLNLNIKGTTYTVNITEGKGNLTLSNLTAETYNIIVTFDGDDYYESTKTSNFFIVTKFTNTTLTVTGTNINYGDDEEILIQITGANNEDVNTIIKVTVNNKTYKVATSNGQGTLTIKNLNAGNYTILAELEGDTNYEYINTTDDFTVSKNTNANIKLNATKITYGENATINIELTGPKNEKLNGTVNLEIENKTYTTTVTDGKGTATVSNLSGGTHTILANYTGDENYESTTTTDTIEVEKLNTTLIFKNMTTNVVLNGARNGEWFNVTLKDTNGNILVNKSILIAFNGKVYNKTTDENGIAKLQINIGYQSANTFAITFLGDENYSGNVSCAIIVVNTLKTKLTAAKTTYTYKSSAKTKTVKATLKLSNGTLVSGQTISVKINGASYQATTNSKGVATITIPITKKGTYTATITFAGNNQYTKSTASTKVKIS